MAQARDKCNGLSWTVQALHWLLQGTIWPLLAVFGQIWPVFWARAREEGGEPRNWPPKPSTRWTPQEWHSAGRVSRLLTLMALYQHGYEVGRYISLERLVEEAKEDYYHVLQKSSQRWHDAKHDLLPWLNHSLAIAGRAYGEFEQRAGDLKSKRGAKTELVEHAIESTVSEFAITDLERACPGVSRDLIRLLLRDLKSAGRVECLGRGPGAKWRKRVTSCRLGDKQSSPFEFTCLSSVFLNWRPSQLPTTRTLTPSMPGRVSFATRTAPRHPSQIWFQNRHHQDKSHASRRHSFAHVLAATLASVKLCFSGASLTASGGDRNDSDNSPTLDR